MFPMAATGAERKLQVPPLPGHGQELADVAFKRGKYPPGPRLRVGFDSGPVGADLFSA